eukprot:19746-Heterococcus_DN1.PRE.1
MVHSPERSPFAIVHVCHELHCIQQHSPVLLLIRAVKLHALAIATATATAAVRAFRSSSSQLYVVAE